MGGMGIFWEARPYLEEIPATLTWLEIHAFSTERSAAHCSRFMQNKWRNVENVALTRVKETEEVQSRSEHFDTRNPWRRTSCGVKYYRRLYCQSRFLDGNGPVGCALSESNPIFHYSWCEQVEKKRWLVCLNDTPHSSWGSYSKRPALLSDIKHWLERLIWTASCITKGEKKLWEKNTMQGGEGKGKIIRKSSGYLCNVCG